MFPSNATTFIVSTTTAGTYDLLPASSTPLTVLSLILSNSGINDQMIKFGTKEVLFTTDADIRKFDTNYSLSNATVTLVKAGTAHTFVSMTYIPTSQFNNVRLNYQESLFISMVFLFFVSLAVWGFVFRKVPTI